MPTLEAFMTKLVRDMAFDISTADVRAAVFKVETRPQTLTLIRDLPNAMKQNFSLVLPVSFVPFQGLTYLLDNHLSHPLLKNLLPGLGDFVHDSSEKVRVAFLDLLLKVKGLRTIKVYWFAFCLFGNP